MIRAFLFYVFIFSYPSSWVWSADCQGIFPDAISNSNNSGKIEMNWNARVINSPDNILDTRNFIDNAGSGNSCNGVSCSDSNSVVPAVNWNSYPNGSDVTVPFLGSLTLAPGNYGKLTVNSAATLTLQAGEYTFNDDISILSLGNVIVSGTDKARIFAKKKIDINFLADVNVGGDAEQLFMYANEDINIISAADVKAVLYSKKNVTLNSLAEVTGAITAKFDVKLEGSAEVTFEQSAVDNADYGSFCTNVAGSVLDHFVINIGGAGGSTCVSKAITITAEDSSNNTIDTYDGTVTLTTSRANGDWSKLDDDSNPSSDPANGLLALGMLDSGSANYTFIAGTNAGEDAGSVVLFLFNQHADDLTITVNDIDLGVSTVSSIINFRDNVFVIDSIDSLVDDVVALRDHRFTATLWQRDISLPTSNCAVATNYMGTHSLKSWISRAVEDPNGIAPTIDGSVVLPNAVPGANNISIAFTAGVGGFDLETSDVGKYAVNLRDDSGSFASGTDIDGSSMTYIVRPFGFDIQVLGNPAAVNENGAIFETAANEFSATVRAIGWQSIDDSDDDGAPDNHGDGDPANNADLSNNTVLSSFGLENPAEAVQLSSVLFSPVGGVDSGLDDGDAVGDGRVLNGFSAGSDNTSDVKFSEVGIIEVFADISDGDYLSAGLSATAKMHSGSSHVGRFIPAYFSLSNNSLIPGCGSFTYMDQDFSASYRVEAFNIDDGLTNNYRDDYIKISPTLGVLDWGAIDTGIPTPLTLRFNNTANSFTNGNGKVDIASTVDLDRNIVIDGIFTQLAVGVQVTDDDGVTVRNSDLNLDVDNDTVDDHVEIGTAEVRYGRLVLEDAFGPEIYTLPVGFYTEYWTGNSFVRNTGDNCTQINLADIAYPDGTIDVPANLTVSVGAGSSTGNYSDVSGGSINFSSGDADHFFSAPGQGNTGSFNVDVDMSAYPWLQYDWNGDGSDDSVLPQATYTFGSYRGHDRIIHWRERFD